MWNQWPVAAVPAAAMAAPPPQPAVPPPLPDAPPPPPPVDNTPTAVSAAVTAGVPAASAGAYMGAGATQSASNPYEQYTPAQYAAMTPEQQYALQQHWQQWQTYQQEYAKWDAQYGEQYKREMAAAAAANTVPAVAPAPIAAVAPVVPVVGPLAAAVGASVPAIGPVYPQTMMGPQMAIQQAQPPPQTYFPQPQMQPPAPQTHSQTQMHGKIMAQPQMYNQPPPPPPQVYQQQRQPQQHPQQQHPQQQHPQQQHPQQQPIHHQQQPPPNQWQQPPPARFNQMPPTSYNKVPNPGDHSGMFPNLQQPPPSFMQLPPPPSSTAPNHMEAPWSKGPPIKGKDAEQRPLWDGPPPDVGQQPPLQHPPPQQGPVRNTRSQGIEPGKNNTNSNQGAIKPNQFGSRRNWPSNPPGNNNSGNNNNMSRNNPFNTAPQPGHFSSDEVGASRGGPNSGMGPPGAGNFNSDAASSGPCNSGNFGGPSGNYGGNFGNNGSGQGSVDDFVPGNFGNNGNNNNRRSGRWESNRPQQGGGNFGPPNNSNNNYNEGGFNRPNQQNYSQQHGMQQQPHHQQQQHQHQQQQQRGPDLDEASFDRLFNQWEKQFEDWKRANANHPDRDEYRRYEEEFEKQRRRIAERREQMRRRRQIHNPLQGGPLPNPQEQQQSKYNPRQQQHPGAGGGRRYGDYEEGEGYSDEENYGQPGQQPRKSPDLDQQKVQVIKKQQQANSSDDNRSHHYSPESEGNEKIPQPESASKELQTSGRIPADHIQQAAQKPKKELNSPKAQLATKQGKFQKGQPQDEDTDTTDTTTTATTLTTAAALGKRKNELAINTSTPAKQTKQENILIISLDDDDDDVDEVQQLQDKNEESAVDTLMKNIFKKTDGIPGLDLVDETAAATGAPVAAKSNSADNKKIPSLFDVVIDKPGKSPQERVASESQKEAATVSEPIPDNVTNVLKDPEFMNNLSQALAQAKGREREQQQQQQQQQQSNERSENANSNNKNNNISNTNNDSNEGRALSFAEWQRKKNNQKNSSQSSQESTRMPADGTVENVGSELGCATNETGNRGGFGPGGGNGPDQRPPHGFGHNGPPFGPNGQVTGPNFVDFNGPPGGNFGPNGPLSGPNFGGPNFGRPGPGPFGGGGPGPNGPFGRNFGPGGPNNPNFNGPGPNFNDRGPNFGPNFRGNGPGHGPGPGPYRSNFCGPNGPGPGPNFGGPGPFGGPGGPNSPAPFDRNFGRGPNNPNDRKFGAGPGPNERHFGSGPGANNPNFNGPNMGSNNDNPFRRNGGPPPPNFDDGPGFGPRGKGPPNQQKNFMHQRNNFGNAGNNDNNKPWSDGGRSFRGGGDAPNRSNRNMQQQRGPSAEHCDNSRSNEPVFRPMQVFDYQNSRSTAAKVIDYGHKSADSAASRIGIGGPGPGLGAGPASASGIPDFRPGVTFDYGHASHNGPVPTAPTVSGAAPLKRNPNTTSTNKKKNKKKNKNRQRLLQQQQQQQSPQDQQSSMLTDHEELNAPQRAAGNPDDLEDISESEDNLTDVSRSESTPPPPPPPPPPPKLNNQESEQQTTHKAFPADPQRRMLTEPPTALFPSTAAANQQLAEQSDCPRMEMSVPTNENHNTISIDEVLLPPGRKSRPKRICIILRGPPGCGKSYVARLIKEKELEMGGANPRIHSIDDYFIIENDYEEKCPKTGKKIPKKELLYEYDDTMEETYMQYLIKSFKKTLSDNLYDIVIVDCNNNSLRTLNEFYCNAKDSNFVPYIVDMHCDVETCLGRNSHKRSEDDIRDVLANWGITPLHYIKLDVSSLLENVVEMEDVENMATDDNANCEESAPAEAVAVAVAAEEDEDSNSTDTANDCGFLKSKWESDTTVENLARLDGTTRLMQKRKTASMADYLQLDEWEPRTGGAAGKKRVRWADIEEKRAQKKMRAIGFVVGQTDWKRMMDPNAGNRALNKTKYIERVNKRR